MAQFEFDGILLKPCLLQPCLHVAGLRSATETGARTRTAEGPETRRRVNMVGVNMVLAEYIKFKHGLYKSCGIECFEGIMLEPCLLQPCFHVAGLTASGRGPAARPEPLRG